MRFGGNYAHKWINIPGKGRRWLQPSGELMMEKPGIGFLFFSTAGITAGILGSALGKSSGLPAYQMSGPGVTKVRYNSKRGKIIIVKEACQVLAQNTKNKGTRGGRRW
jgi:hypothetical protein